MRSESLMLTKAPKLVANHVIVFTEVQEINSSSRATAENLKVVRAKLIKFIDDS